MMEPTITPSTTKGVVIALLLIFLALVTYFMDLETSNWLQYISYIVFIAGVIWSVTSYGKQVDHRATFGNYFVHGFKVAALVTCIMILYVIIFVSLFPEIKEKGLETARKSMEARGNMTTEQITQALEITKKFFMVFILGTTLLGYLIFGALAAVIGAGITKKNTHPFDSDINQIGS